MPRALADIQADIDDVRTQIAAARKASSYSVNGRSVSRAYTELRRELADLQAELAAAQSIAAGGDGIARFTVYRRY